MNFLQLRTEVQTALIDTPPAIQSLTGSLVNRAIRTIQRKHNFKAMEQATTLTTTQETRILGSRPALWKAPRGKPYFVGDLDGFGELEWVSRLADAYAQWGTDPDLDVGSPAALNEDAVNGQFLLFPYSDGLSSSVTGEYSITIPYWGYTADLTADTGTNWFTDNAEEYILFTATSQGFYLNEDEDRAMIWEKRAMEKRREVMLADKQRYLDETSTLVPYTGANMPHTPKLWR